MGAGLDSAGRESLVLTDNVRNSAGMNPFDPSCVPPLILLP